MNNADRNRNEASVKEKAEIRFYASAEEQEKARLKEAVMRTDAEKFYFLMHLMKMQQAIKKGKIHYKQ